MKSYDQPISSRRRRRRMIIQGGAGLASILTVPSVLRYASAQDNYPTRAIDILYGFGPGSSGDLTCRLVGNYLRKKWNVPINVINKPGGNTLPACLELYGAAPDGYTLLGDPPGSSSMLGAAVRNLPFKVADRTFIAMIGSSGMLLVVPPNSRLKTMKDLTEELKKNPEQFRWTSQGAATPDLVFRRYAKSIGVDVSKTKPVTARGASEIVTLTAGGQVQLGILVIASAIPAIQGGLVRPLAIMTNERAASLPEVQTATEQGHPGIATPTFIGISGPPKLPAFIVEKWNVALREMLKDPEMIDQLGRIGSSPFYMDSAEFRKYVLDEAAVVDALYDRR